MRFTIYYRRADGRGTQTFMSGLKEAQAIRARQRFFESNLSVTMCWALDDAGQMWGSVLTREPIELPVRTTNNRHCTCFGDAGLHASTHLTDQGECCDLCGWPVAAGSTDVLSAINAGA